jgi:hypothetical protein
VGIRFLAAFDAATKVEDAHNNTGFSATLAALPDAESDVIL